MKICPMQLLFNDSDDRYEGMLVVRSELISMCSIARLLEVLHTLVLLLVRN